MNHQTATGKRYEFRLTRRVEFCDTDMAGIMHFSNYFRFMEATETAFLRSLGLSVLLSRCGLEVCLPRVHAECDFSAPLHFEDEVLIHLVVERLGERSLTYEFRFYNGARQVARGRVVLACAARGDNGHLKAVPLPKALTDTIAQAPPDLLRRAPSDKQPVASNRATRQPTARVRRIRNTHPISAARGL